jgi:cytochrome P450
LSDLITGGQLSAEELPGVTAVLFKAGTDTTVAMFALSVLLLVSDPDWSEVLSCGPARIATATEELLRYLTVFQLGAFTRTATESLELGGITIARGESVWISLAAANRDPARFEMPAVLDLSRDASGHLAFGHGRHMCLGQHLARLELRLGLAALVSRFPHLRLDEPLVNVKLHHHEHILHGVHELPVAW